MSRLQHGGPTERDRAAAAPLIDDCEPRQIQRCRYADDPEAPQPRCGPLLMVAVCQVVAMKSRSISAHCTAMLLPSRIYISTSIEVDRKEYGR